MSENIEDFMKNNKDLGQEELGKALSERYQKIQEEEIGEAVKALKKQNPDEDFNLN